MHVSEFNALPPDAAAAILRECADIPTWATTVVAARPFASADHLHAVAREAADAWTDREVDEALAAHPRIGERRQQQDALSAHSEAEQAGVATDTDTQERLRVGNERYEEQFDRVFLIRAAGRDADEILAELERRLTNDPATERQETADQLREIALLRLDGAVEGAPPPGTQPSMITTHVLDAMSGLPAQGVAVTLTDEAGDVVATATTDDDGRIRDLGPATLRPGLYRLTFATGTYFAERGVETFYPEVVITFTLTPGRAHLHVPILLSPFAYSTYRGS